MHYLTLAGSHHEMGKMLGGMLRSTNARFPLILDDFQRRFGEKSQAILKAFFPEAIEEIGGLTEQLDLDDELFTSWMLCMGCCLYNMNSTSSVETRGCTAFAFESAGRCYYGRNNDLPPYLEDGCKSIAYSPRGGIPFRLNTSSFINGEEGMNSEGLAVAMTFVAPHLAQIKPGLNSVFIVRYLLERCGTTREALAAVEELPIASSCNILLCDSSGEMLVAECAPDRVHIRRPLRNDGGEPYVIAVNNFTSPGMREYVNRSVEDYDSESRYSTVEAALAHRVENPTGYCEKLLSGEYGFICQYAQQAEFKTVWSTIFDIGGGETLLAEGRPGVGSYRKLDMHF